MLSRGILDNVGKDTSQIRKMGLTTHIQIEPTKILNPHRSLEKLWIVEGTGSNLIIEKVNHK